MESLLDYIESIKNDLTDIQYKTILDLMKIYFEKNKLLKSTNQKYFVKLQNLMSDYIKLSKFNLTLTLEREGIFDSSIFTMSEINNVEVEYQEFSNNSN
jgi:hypothetical protein